jgi:sulfur-carrier protein adenylyltransferase/sulfurtransferase
LVLALLLKLEPGVLGEMISVEFRSLRFGRFSFAGASEPAGPMLSFIAPEQVTPSDVVIDVRGLSEAPVSPFAHALRIGVEELEQSSSMHIPEEGRVVLCCRSGVRAWRAAQALARRGRRDLALIALGE